ncbi:alpha-L-fucosidase [Nonomuraea angiospora]|uniref:alpha-L-fucosidase n=1 Tax=Nonomuraea angiospora TaxID=46172 RepID=UPI0034510E02
MPMQPWFPDARLGIFIHYGLYAVEGVAESWSFYYGGISREAYLAQLNGFTADGYDPAAWAELFAQAGARYAVLTTRHHDGFALWDSAYGELNVTASPAGRDLVGPFADALRERAAGTQQPLQVRRRDQRARREPAPQPHVDQA